MFKRIFRNLPVIVALLVFAGVCLFSLVNADLLTEPLLSLRETGNFAAFTRQVQKAYVSDRLTQKDFFITLNGLYARLTNRHVYNDVVRLNNGYIFSFQTAPMDVQPYADAIISFSDYSADVLDTPFLCVQTGRNFDQAKTMLPADAEAYDYENGDRLLACLEAAGVPCLNLRPLLNATVEQTERNYYRTDHHWTYTAALTATGYIMQAMDDLLDGRTLDMTYTDPAMWESHVLSDHFLGSYGRRVGPLYAGTDDFVYYTPRFDTRMSCAVSPRNALSRGSFADVIIQDAYFRKDYYHGSTYTLYIGGDRELVNHRNPTAPNDIRVLLIKDSFALPVQAYMSTIFRELDVVDPRHYTDTKSLRDYLCGHDYDLILFLHNPSSIADGAYPAFFRVDDAEAPASLTVAEFPEFSVPADSGKHNCRPLPVNLKPGVTYTVHIDRAGGTVSNAGGFNLRLMNSATGTSLSSKVFDLAYGNRNGGFTWVFTVPPEAGHAVQLLLYAGIDEATADLSLTCEGVTLTEHP